MELWKHPVSFCANKSDIPLYPVRCLPEPIRSMAERAKEFDPANPATYYLTVCSSLFSNLFEVRCFGDTVQLNLFSFIFENPAVKGFITRSYCNVREMFQKKYGNCSIPFRNAHAVEDMDLPNISLNYFQDFWGDILSHEKSRELLFAVPSHDVGSIHERDLDEDGQFQRLFERTLYNKIYGNGNCRILTLSDDAAKLFSDYCATKIYSRLSTEFAVCPEWCENYPKLILKLCGLIHCIAYSNAGAEPAATINGMTMTAALQLAEYYKCCAIYAFSSNRPTGKKDEEYVLDKIKTSSKQKISRRDLLHLCRKFHTLDELNKSVQILIDFGWLWEVEPIYRGYGRKPSPVLEVNPLLFGKRT
ncbi:MAG: DUF3987 domain-containing protein [Oscillospiraceae bacterium]